MKGTGKRDKLASLWKQTKKFDISILNTLETTSSSIETKKQWNTFQNNNYSTKLNRKKSTIMTAGKKQKTKTHIRYHDKTLY